MKNIKNFFQKEDAIKPAPDPICPKQPIRNPRMDSPAEQNTVPLSPRRVMSRPGFSNDDCKRLRKIQYAYELVYGRRLSVAEMFFAMLDKHITEDYPEIVPYIKQFDELEKNNK